MLKNLFNKIMPLRKKVSIYNKIVELNGNIRDYNFSEYVHVINREVSNPGEYEYNYIIGEVTPLEINSYELGEAVVDFTQGEEGGLVAIRRFFSENLLLSSIKSFENYLYSGIIFDDTKLVSLAILLMRDSYEFESVKFGIYLTKFFPLENYPKIIEIIENLIKIPEFTFYVLDSVKNTRLKEKIVYKSLDDIQDYGYKIWELKK